MIFDEGRLIEKPGRSLIKEAIESATAEEISLVKIKKNMLA